MSDRDALLAAIREAPRDDAPRLIYADWLDEHGEPDLAEFVRLQIEIDPLRRRDGDLDRWRRAVIDQHLSHPVPADFPPEWLRYAELARREHDLYDAHRWEWLGTLGMLEGEHDSHLSVRFCRGFAEEVALATSAFLSDAEVVRSSCPFLRRLTLYGPRDQVAELAAVPALNGIPELELAGWITAYDARFLASSFALRSVESLTLWVGSREDVQVIRTLGRPPWDGGPTGSTRPLSGEPHLPALREVVLVQVHGGMRAEDPRGHLDRRANRLAGEFNHILGRAVARVERPWARRFPLAANIGCELVAGRLVGNPMLAAGGRHPVLLGFDADGRQVREDEFELNPSVSGFSLGTIFIREFASELADLSVFLWGNHEDAINNPDVPGDMSADEEACASLDGYWMKGGNFVIQFAGTDYWAGPDGTIHPD